MKKDITVDLNKVINSSIEWSILKIKEDLAANLLRGILEIRRDVMDEEYSSYIIKKIDQLLINNDFEILPTSDINTKLAKNIDELGLSERSLNCLRSEGLNYIGDVVRKSPSDLLKISYFGRKSLNELEGKLRKIGLNLGSNFIDV
jgi:DNA-directed RNA polymerase alpha subunit